MLLTAEGGADGCDCDRGSFLAGSWGGGTPSPLPDPCAAVVVRRELPPRRRERIRFYSRFRRKGVCGSTVSAAGTACIRGSGDCCRTAGDHTARRTAERPVHRWIARQALVCRIYARTAFYQCGGAWGFRDQLQDSLGALWLDPQVTRRQLMRCARYSLKKGRAALVAPSA